MMQSCLLGHCYLIVVSSSGAWRVIVFPWMSWAPLWWCTAPGPAGPSSRLVPGLVVEESPIAHVNAPILGECSVIGEGSWTINLLLYAPDIFQTCIWRQRLRGSRRWGRTLSPAGKCLLLMFTVGPSRSVTLLSQYKQDLIFEWGHSPALWSWVCPCLCGRIQARLSHGGGAH